MTREDALELFTFNGKELTEQLHEYVNRVYDDFEKEIGFKDNQDHEERHNISGGLNKPSRDQEFKDKK